MPLGKLRLGAMNAATGTHAVGGQVPARDLEVSPKAVPSPISPGCTAGLGCTALEDPSQDSVPS